MTLAACGGSSTTTSSTTPPPNLPNIAQIESAIAATLRSDKHVVANVLCPSSVPQLTGETFSCIAVASKPRVKTFQFLVTEHGGTFVTYALTG